MFLTNAQMKTRMFQPDNRRPTPSMRHADRIVATQQPRALPAYSANAQSSIPGISLLTPASVGL